MPTVFGVRDPVLLLPADFTAQDGGVDGVIAHELAHIRRRDQVVQMVARATVAVFWWNPVVWLLLLGLTTSSEEACDDWAIALTGRRREYAAALVWWAESVGSAGALGYAHWGNALLQRIRRVLDGEGTPQVHVPRFARAAIAVCAALIIVAAGGLRMQAAVADGDWAGTIERDGVKLSYEAGVNEAYLEPVAEVVSVAKTTMDDLFPEMAGEEVGVYVRPAVNWYENTVSDRRNAVHIRLGPKGLGEAFRGDAGPVGILCQAVAELYNPRRVPGLDRYLAHRYLVEAVRDRLGLEVLPREKATPLAEDGEAMLALLTDHVYALVHPDVAAAAALAGIEDRLGWDGLRSLLSEIPEDVEDPFAVLREAALRVDAELAAAFDYHDAAKELPVRNDGTAMIASFEQGEEFTAVETHPLAPAYAPLWLVFGGPFTVSRSDEWARMGRSLCGWTCRRRGGGRTCGSRIRTGASATGAPSPDLRWIS